MSTTIFVNIIRSPVLRSLLSALAGFIIYGLWAYWVNSSEDRGRALVSALTQGSYSFIITLVLNFFMEWFYTYLVTAHRVKLHRNSKARSSLSGKKWLIPTMVIIATCLILYTTSWSIHVLANTPMIFFTILPGAIISSIYTVIYVVGIHCHYPESERAEH